MGKLVVLTKGKEMNKVITTSETFHTDGTRDKKVLVNGGKHEGGVISFDDIAVLFDIDIEDDEELLTFIDSHPRMERNEFIIEYLKEA